jgi:hypothetical protein
MMRVAAPALFGRQQAPGQSLALQCIGMLERHTGHRLCHLLRLEGGPREGNVYRRTPDVNIFFGLLTSPMKFDIVCLDVKRRIG